MNGGSTLSSANHKALLFTTGPYTSYITSLVLGLNPPSGTPFTGALNISLWSATNNGTEYEPDTQLAITGTQSVTIISTQNLYTFDGIFGGGFSMSANTPYALVLSSDANEIKWGRTRDSTPTSSDGFTFHSFNLSTDSGGIWTTSSVAQDNAIVMEVAVISVIPEPSSSLALLVLFSTCFLSRRRNR
ncbi:MAG: choice-of-anchor R domain-containing protein [Luteolibacter sp.]